MINTLFFGLGDAIQLFNDCIKAMESMRRDEAGIDNGTFNLVKDVCLPMLKIGMSNEDHKKMVELFNARYYVNADIAREYSIDSFSDTERRVLGEIRRYIGNKHERFDFNFLYEDGEAISWIGDFNSSL